ncbi:MAG TPA: isoprenylcysteine carboxylmethyltransferase family protein [Nitrospinaceae bacterium]|nr:isoprenylcysteine carboxylmethyltransferase family protein [Nitrospinaceae bacterium]
MTLSPALIKAFIIFPLNVMGVIPAFILWYEGKFKLHQLEVVTAISGGVLVACGLVICWVTVSLFTDHGEGTPAPFAPPKKLVVIGFYRYMRNPMMTGVWCVLTGEAIFFKSPGIALWFMIFFAGCMALIPLWEEPDLEKRFGESYREYKKKVPRWIPRLTALL